MALMQIDESNKVLAEFFADHPDVLDQFSRFEKVLEKAQLLQYTNFDAQPNLIRESIHSTFSERYSHFTHDFRSSFIH